MLAQRTNAALRFLPGTPSTSELLSFVPVSAPTTVNPSGFTLLSGNGTVSNSVALSGTTAKELSSEGTTVMESYLLGGTGGHANSRLFSLLCSNTSYLPILLILPYGEFEESAGNTTSL